jgi:hypothetical protein
MQSTRPTPFDLVFREAAETIFPPVRDALAATGHDPRNRDAFLMVREVITLIRDLRPEEGLGEEIDQLAALIHHSYLFWDAGRPTIAISPEDLPTLLASEFPFISEQATRPPYYAQLPLRRIWAQVVGGEPPEPLDGCFVHSIDGSTLKVLGVFGIHPERAGFSVVEVSGLRPAQLRRQDGTSLFSPSLPGGALAGLFSLAGEEELLELGWRLQLGAGSRELGARSISDDLLPAPSS